MYIYRYRGSLNPVEGTPSRVRAGRGDPLQVRAGRGDPLQVRAGRGVPPTTFWCFWTLSFSRILLVFRFTFQPLSHHILKFL